MEKMNLPPVLDGLPPVVERLPPKFDKMQSVYHDMNGFTLGAIGVTLFLIVMNYILSPAYDSSEPPLAPAFPIFGHTFGFMFNSFGYYEKLNKKLRLPIFTIRMPGRKIYVITKPDLITRVDRQSKAFSFAPIVSEFSSVTCGTSKEANEILNQNLLGEHGNWGLCEDMVAGMRESLKPGENLDFMNRTMAKEVCGLLNATKPEAGKEFRNIKLMEWVAEVVTMATTNSVYGPMNPYKSQEVKDAFWEFEKGIMRMLVAPFPSYTAKDSIEARNKVTAVLGEYFANGYHEQGSGLAKARFDYSVRNNVPLADIGRFEIGGTIAILVNTLPSCYWMLLLVHFIPGLLQDLRKEVDAALIIDEKTKKATIDITIVKNECPLLLSTLKESLRSRGMGTAVRIVVQDAEVGGYMLKKGAMVQIPLQVINNNVDHWGDEAEMFEPRRFVKEAGKKVPDDSGYRSFGGGKHLCPGRWFATNEILAVVALFISRYEMRPANGGEWVLPTTVKSNPATQVAQPDFELDMEVRNRPGFEQYTWNVELSKSNKVTAVLAGDKP
ncbi:cytochrome P450 [Aspergillus stella-maris]|uniref:cytochrome P450 n=1 Tax=Aspergillus stella-maris TaxID=1810926 RepID=UPI003CCE3DAB